MIKCRQIYIAHLIYGNQNVFLDILDVLETDLFKFSNYLQTFYFGYLLQESFGFVIFFEVFHVLFWQAAKGSQNYVPCSAVPALVPVRKFTSGENGRQFLYKLLVNKS